MNGTKDSAPAIKQPASFWKSFGMMGIIALGAAVASLPTCGISLLLGGAFGAWIWMSNEKPQKEKVMKKSAIAGAITGMFLGIIGAIMLLFVPTPQADAAQWIAIISIIVAAVSVFSTFTGLLGGSIYRSRTFGKPAAPASTAEIPRPAARPASVHSPAAETSRSLVQPALKPGIVDVTDVDQGEILTLPADAHGWDQPMVELLRRKDSCFKVAILRHELDVLLFNAEVKISTEVYQAGVTAIGYGTTDEQNESIMQKANPIVLVPADVVYRRPLSFYVPQGSSSMKLLILRHDQKTVRIIEMPILSWKFHLKLNME